MAGNGTMVWYMWLVEVPLQVGKYHRGLITNAFSDSSTVYYALTMRSIWLWGSQLDLLPFVCQRTTCRSRFPTFGTCTWVGSLNSPGTCLSMRDCGCQECKSAQPWSWVRKRVGIRGRGEGQWLAWIFWLGLIPRKCERDSWPGCPTRLKISHG